MSNLTPEQGQAIAKYNINVLYHLPRSYTAIHYYLDSPRSTLKYTLYDILHWIQDIIIIPRKNRYELTLDNTQLTRRVRRKQTGSEGTSSRHFNMICCMGLLNKQYQSQEKNILTHVNERFISDTGSKTEINVFSIRRYTPRELDRIEARSQRLIDAGVTVGNLTAVNLSLNGLEDIRAEVFFRNSRKEPEKKATEAGELFAVMDALTDTYGYTTRDNIKENLTLSDREIDMLFRILKRQIGEAYTYKRPTREQIERWSLPDKRYIYTKKEPKE